MANLKLSVLDQSPISAGNSPTDAIAASVELAQHCDQLGYRRYWLSEHHLNPALAGSSPEILITRIAALTTNMRIGAGGVMLNNYSPLKIVENFKVLHALFPGRIDLGLGRAIDNNQRRSNSLAVKRGSPDGKSYTEKIWQILDSIGISEFNTTSRHADGNIPTSGGPEIWLLGSSITSASDAANLSISYSYAHFINQADSVKAMNFYREEYKPAATKTKPQGSICVFVICAETQEAADHIALSHAGYLVDQRTRIPGAIPAPKTVQETSYTPQQTRLLKEHLKRTIAGSPQTIKAKLTALAAAHSVDELIILTNTYDFEDRLRSYGLLADLF